MVGVTKSSKENQKLFKRIKKVQKEHRDKEAKFEQNVDVEKIFQRKRKQFIIKTKKEIEQEKQREKEMEEQEKREKLNYLFEIKQGYENNFDLLSMVSKQYHDKEEYVNHLDNLR